MFDIANLFSFVIILLRYHKTLFYFISSTEIRKFWPFKKCTCKALSSSVYVATISSLTSNVISSVKSLTEICLWLFSMLFSPTIILFNQIARQFVCTSIISSLFGLCNQIIQKVKIIFCRKRTTLWIFCRNCLNGLKNWCLIGV